MKRSRDLPAAANTATGAAAKLVGPDGDVALLEVIERAELESAAATAQQLRDLEAAETPPATDPAPLAAALDQTGHSLRTALELLSLGSAIDFRTVRLQQALQAVAICLDTAALTLTRTAAEARQAPAAIALPRASSILARQSVVAVAERRNTALERDSREIEQFSLTVRDATLEVSALPVTAPLPPPARSLISQFDPPQRLNMLQAAIWSSRKTVPKLQALEHHDMLPISLDTHAHSIGTSASMARSICQLLRLSEVIRARHTTDRGR